ncbi:MAG: FG-GAP-like repeat-containing protein [Acidobacteria bacterium]|nr:FG-GAP-like repeat-containing protein [Acidobacteriota bacterium]
MPVLYCGIFESDIISVRPFMKMRRSSALFLILPPLVLSTIASTALLPQASRLKVQTGKQSRVQKAAPVSAPTREDAYRANNLGVALLEQFRHREGAVEFRRALSLDPRLAIARINLAIALYNIPDVAEASNAARAAVELVPDAPQPHYILGLIARQQNETDLAVAEFQRVLKVDPQDVGANVQLGQLYAQQRKYREAVAAFRAAIEAEPYNGTALYNLATALLRSGQRDDGQRLMQRFQMLRDSGAATIIGQNYLEQGRYAEAVRSALYHNDGGGKFSDRTTAAGIPVYPYLSVSCAFADVDHDGDLDIFIAGFADTSKLTNARSAPAPGAPNVLLRNNGNGTFTDITAQAKVEGGRGHAVAVVPTDYDNRRDVDLLVVNYGVAPTLYRNLRDGTFRNVAPEVGLDAKDNFTSVAAGDLNKDGFIDFYFGAADTPGTFALSDGKGHFRREPAPAAHGDATGAQFAVLDAAQFLDYDNDGLLDLVTLTTSATSGALGVRRNTGAGWPDVSEAAIKRNTFNGTSPIKERLAPRTLASGDVDGDGDTDLFVRASSGELRFLRNVGGNRNHSVRVRLSGKVSNRSGVEAKIEMRAGSLRQKLETYSAMPAPAPADVIFGIGQREAADAVRVLWPSGVVQAETETASKEGAQVLTRIRAGSTLGVTELDRKPSSCPFLYAWNGERFEFITDFMGGGEMGDWVAPGVFNTPDPDEYVRIRRDQLRPRDGRYELRVTNELEEALFVDRLQLVAVAHPEGTEVYPNEGLGNPTASTFKLYATRDAHPPRAARDEHGHDVLPLISRVDRKYPDDFRLARIRGYAEEHTLTLDLGRDESGGRRDERRDERGRVNDKGNADGQTAAPSSTLIPPPSSIILLMTGWTDYAFSSDNVAASQGGLSMMPPSLQVKDKEGKWRTVIESIGIPVGRPQTVTVDLTGKFLSASREVRVLTNMRVYWDQILVDTSGGGFPARIERLDPLVADLHTRGFSAESSPDGREPSGYDYARVSLASPWKTFTGRYTREGDVRELLQETDDMFVVSRPGDELALSFDARALAPLPGGWTRTFLLYADGFSKEMDINSASPDQLAPLPFHGMKRYPYTAPEHYPLTPARQAYIERYNTRVVVAPVTELVGKR